MTQNVEAQLGEIDAGLADGRGVVRGNGKTVFVDGALANERVKFRIRRRRKQYDEAELLEVAEASPHRVTPRCKVFGVCGACSLQHADAAYQLEVKTADLLDSLARIGRVEPDELLPAITGPVWGYRRKARLAAKFVHKKNRVLLGFRERLAPYVTDMQRCEVLHPAVGNRIGELAELLGQLSIRAKVPQIEMAAGDENVVLVLRVLAEPSVADIAMLEQFESSSGLRVLLQRGGPSDVTNLSGEQGAAEQHYRLASFSKTVSFVATDFIQVNQPVNDAMVAQALDQLNLQPGQNVLELHAGLGNFSVAIAPRVASLIAMEGDAHMVARAQRNAAAQGLGNVRFLEADLTSPDGLVQWQPEAFDRVLLDPPRSGAEAVVRQLGRLRPARIVYVSCNPGTLARDAGQLVHEHGYRLAAAGIMDMFPHTRHVESMAIFSL